jgi:hypothetical protein
VRMRGRWRAWSMRPTSLVAPGNGLRLPQLSAGAGWRRPRS